MRKSKKEVRRFELSVKSAATGMAVLKRAMIAIGTGYVAHRLISSIQATATELDKLAKASDKLGIASERLAGLDHAAVQSGVAVDTLRMALQRMTRRVSEAAAGTGEAKDAIKELGLDAQKLNELAPDQILARVADQMATVTNSSDRLRLAFKLFDSEGVAMVNVLQDGAKGLEKFHAEAAALGMAISREDLEKVERMNDALDVFKKAVGSFKLRNIRREVIGQRQSEVPC
jgi:hypothetical protein